MGLMSFFLVGTWGKVRCLWKTLGAFYLVVCNLLEHETLPVSKGVPAARHEWIMWQEDDRGTDTHAPGDRAHLLTHETIR